MDQESIIYTIRNAWQALVCDESLLITEVAQNVFTCHIEEDITNSGFIDTLWTHLVYEFCEQGKVSSAFDMPLEHLTEGTIFWIEDLMFIFLWKIDNKDIIYQVKPKIIHPVMISIGGLSGVGKTTVMRMMKSKLRDTMIVRPAFTTRPKRNGEVEGMDYYFRNIAMLEQARQDPRYTGFVEARGNWYWINPSELLKSLWNNPDKIHVFLNSQRHEFEYRKRMFPKLHWIWLDADLSDLEARLRTRGDSNVEESMTHNRNLRRQPIDDLVSLRIATQTGDIDATVNEIITYCNLLSKERS